VFAIFGLTHLQLLVRDLDRSIRFYSEMFGMEEFRRLGDDAVMLRTPGTKEVFTLNRDSNLVAHAGEMGGIAHFGFRLQERQDMALLLQKAVEAGGTALKHGVRMKGTEEYAMVNDPDGYQIEVFWETPQSP
jgi:catechol-2,3-dioxygenase